MSGTLLDDEEELAVGLWAHGVRVLSLAREPRGAAPTVDALELVTRLASTSSPVLRACLPVLFLTRGALAADLRAVVGRLSPEGSLAFRTLYTIAVCLQRLWWTRLGLSMPNMARLEDAYSTDLGLPDPERMYGRLCLSAMDPGLVDDCMRTFSVFLEERERELRVAATAGGRE